jgi:ethanolamine utilization protein EutP (predicted NTPase)
VTLLELTYQRRKAKKEAAELLDKAVIETRSLTIPEQVRFDSLTARIQDLDAAIAQRESLRKLVS